MVIIGVDEVGRGCWAGPLVAGAVLLQKEISGLKDSKKLSKQQRESLSELIYKNSLFGLGWVSHTEIDNLGLTKATQFAMERAIRELLSNGEVDYDEIIVDGNLNFLSQFKKSRSLVKADDTVPSVSAASIIAKVARDNYMGEQAKFYPEYSFDKHVGYGTRLHKEAIKQFGPSAIHRMSYKPLQLLA